MRLPSIIAPTALLLVGFSSLVGCGSDPREQPPAATLPTHAGAAGELDASTSSASSSPASPAGTAHGEADAGATSVPLPSGADGGTSGGGGTGGGTGSGPTAASGSCTVSSFTGTLTLTPNAGGDQWASATLKIAGPKHLDKNNAQIFLEVEDLDHGGRSSTPILDTTDDFPSDDQEHPILNWDKAQERTRGVANFNGRVKLRYYAVVAFDKAGPDPHCTTEKIE